MARRLPRPFVYILGLPERLVRSLAAAGGGVVHETAQLVLPRLVRRSRLYEATAKNLLRITVELVGGVERQAEVVAGEFEQSPKKLAIRKAGGNVVELGSIFAFGFSPLWLLAAAADVTHGTRVYLDALVSELKSAGILAQELELASVDDLLAALEGASGTTARLIDIPPLEVESLKQSLADLRDDAKGLPTPPELAAVYQGLVAEADREKRSVLEVSVGMGIAFFNSARKVGRQHVLDPYTDDLRPVRDEGFATYAWRVAKPYGQAVGRHFDPRQPSLTERGLERLGGSKLIESEAMPHFDSFGARSQLTVGDNTVEVFRLDALQERFDVYRLPYTLRILLENLLRHEDGVNVTAADVEAVASWVATDEPSREISFTPARVLLQDFTGVPAVVDLAAMRNAMRDLGGDPKKINPLLPVELVIDHSVQVDEYANRLAIFRNAELEFERNRERYAFLRWGQGAFDNFKVVPPSTGIVHQVNLEFLARVVEERGGVAFPDTLVGTDSHTTMINGLGVLGWGVGGIEAEAAMLGEAISMLVPQVVGFELTGKLPEGATATDLVLTVTQILRAAGVVGKFVEYFGHGLEGLPLADRATIGNMSPEYGATCGFFPVDAETLRYLRLTGRPDERVALVEAYCKENALWHDPDDPPTYSKTIRLDLSTVDAPRFREIACQALEADDVHHGVARCHERRLAAKLAECLHDIGGALSGASFSFEHETADRLVDRCEVPMEELLGVVCLRGNVCALAKLEDGFEHGRNIPSRPRDDEPLVLRRTECAGRQLACYRVREPADVLTSKRATSCDGARVAHGMAVALLDFRRRDDDVICDARDRTVRSARDQPRLALEPLDGLKRERRFAFVTHRDEHVCGRRVTQYELQRLCRRPAGESRVVGGAAAGGEDTGALGKAQISDPVRDLTEPLGLCGDGLSGQLFRHERCLYHRRRAGVREDAPRERRSCRHRAHASDRVGVVFRHARSRLALRDPAVQGDRALRRAHVLQRHRASPDRPHDLDGDRRDRRRVQCFHGEGADWLLR